MTDYTEKIMLSALQHYAYCPRQFALIHIEQVWAENRFTAEGNLLHERVDSGVTEQRGDIRAERGVMLVSEKYQIKGKMDLLEIGKAASPKYFPVEYKRGKPKVQPWDRVQLCAQALCLEEMRDIDIEDGAIWYWEVRRREPVKFDATLRQQTIEVVTGAHALMDTWRTPAPTEDRKRCRACSLLDLCEPDVFRRDLTSRYVEGLFAS